MMTLHDLTISPPAATARQTNSGQERRGRDIDLALTGEDRDCMLLRPTTAGAQRDFASLVVAF